MAKKTSESQVCAQMRASAFKCKYTQHPNLMYLNQKQIFGQFLESMHLQVNLLFFFVALSPKHYYYQVLNNNTLYIVTGQLARLGLAEKGA